MAIPKMNVLVNSHDNGADNNGDDYGNKNRETRRGLKGDNEGNKNASKWLAIICCY